MNAWKVFLIVVIFVMASVAWVFLGQTITRRTSQSERELGEDVNRMFGPPIVQPAPTVAALGPSGPTGPAQPPDGTDIKVRLEHENRYRGLIWFSVYRVWFEATYTVRPANGQAGQARLTMALPRNANIDALSVAVDGKPVDVAGAQVTTDLDLAAGKPAQVKVSYVTAGRDRWVYEPQVNNAGLRNFNLTIQTSFDEIDYPVEGLSPTGKARDIPGGKEATWNYTHMLPAANRCIGVLTPTMPASGRLAARIAEFAPVSLFFFLTVMVTIQLIRNLKIHPMNYLLIAAGFFAFHILLAYLVDHLAIHYSFWIAAAVSVVLVVSYLWLVLGGKAAILYAGLAQLVYLVFFSYAFFWQGWTGLTVVIGAIITLFLIMMLTARIDWDEKFPDLARRREPTPWPLPNLGRPGADRPAQPVAEAGPPARPPMPPGPPPPSPPQAG